MRGDGKKALIGMGLLGGALGVTMLMCWQSHSAAIASGAATGIDAVLLVDGEQGPALAVLDRVHFWTLAGGSRMVWPEQTTAHRLEIVDLTTGAIKARRQLSDAESSGSLAGSSPRYLWFRLGDDDTPDVEALDPYTGQVALTEDALVAQDPALSGGWNESKVDHLGNLWVITNSANELRVDGSTLVATPTDVDFDSVDDPPSSAGDTVDPLDALNGAIRAQDGKEYSFEGSPRAQLYQGDTALPAAGSYISPQIVQDDVSDRPVELDNPPSLLVLHHDSLASAATSWLDDDGNTHDGTHVYLTRVALDGQPLWSWPPPGSSPEEELEAACVWQGGLIAAFDKHVVALDPATGAVRWSTDL
jgi:hypothetical protein